jgi:hypothetical protein
MSVSEHIFRLTNSSRSFSTYVVLIKFLLKSSYSIPPTRLFSAIKNLMKFYFYPCKVEIFFLTFQIFFFKKFFCKQSGSCFFYFIRYAFPFNFLNFLYLLFYKLYEILYWLNKLRLIKIHSLLLSLRST